jgi:hypothetical protein
VANLYERFVGFIPISESAADVGLDASAGLVADVGKACKNFHKTVDLRSLSDEVVDMRAQLFEEWAVWRWTERRLCSVEDCVLERATQMAEVAAMQKSVKALRSKRTTTTDPTVKSLQKKIHSTNESVKSSDAAVVNHFKGILKMPLLHEHRGAA